ncbi:MAG: hypothetical protein M3P27_02350 [Acidobacteriota bacterium]|nr:hypothetical protein [Acidobacteriota bacterium]
MKVALFAMVIVAVACMSVFTVEPGTGSYQAVNGPTTVFQGLRAAMLVMLLVMAGATVVTSYGAHTGTVRATDSERSCTMLC